MKEGLKKACFPTYARSGSADRSIKKLVLNVNLPYAMNINAIGDFRDAVLQWYYEGAC